MSVHKARDSSAETKDVIKAGEERGSGGRQGTDMFQVTGTGGVFWYSSEKRGERGEGFLVFGLAASNQELVV